MATFKTRICNKIDTYQNWIDSKLVPLAGEICIVTVPAETGAVQQEPATLIKVGDGTTEFSLLPWLSGKAADIYDWAKAENKPVYEAKEITGIDTYIADYVESEMGISVDTDTQYTIVPVDGNAYKFKLMSKSKLDEEFTVEVASFEMPEFDHAEMDQAIADNTAAIELLNGDAETAGSVAKAIADAIAALKLDETYDALGAAKAVQGETESTVKAVEDELKAYKESNDAKIGTVAADKTVVGLIQEEASRAAGVESGLQTAVEAAQAAAEAAQGEIDALELVVGTPAEGKTIVKMIEDAQTAATYDDTALAARVKGNEDAIALLNNEATVEGSVDYKIAQAVAAIMENPDETMNSINELVTWCNDHAEDALELSNQVIANRDNLADLVEFVGELPEGSVSTTVVGYIGEAIAALSIGDYAKASDLEAAIGRIAAMEAKVASWDAAEQNAKDYADELNGAMDDRVKIVEGKAHEHTFVESELNKIVEGDVEKWNKAQENAEATAAGALAEAKTELEGKITAAQEAAEKKATDLNDAMDLRMDAAEGKLDVLNGDAETEGSVAKALSDAKAYTDELEGELHAVAKSGDIAALAQVEDTYVIFDCGSATKVI